MNITKNECVGCGACMESCPVNCIEMQPDEEGFMQPNVDRERCISCGICERVCPLNNVKEVEPAAYQKQVKLAYVKDTGKRYEATSGGIFGAAAEYVIEQGGVVFGAKFNENLDAVLDFAETTEAVCSFKKSKYVQADTNKMYSKAKDFLDCGRMVLFTGTPCQIAGLMSYLGDKIYDNLMAIDIICHGVPSPLIFKKYINSLEKKYDSKVKSIDFRYKDEQCGWDNSVIRIEFDDGTSCQMLHAENLYMKIFLKNLILRKSCDDCRYKDSSYRSDLTLGDFWEYDKFYEKIDDHGVSAVVVNSPKGEMLLSKLQNVEMFSASIEALKYGNASYIFSSESHKMRSRYLKHSVTAADWERYTKGVLNKIVLKENIEGQIARLKRICRRLINKRM